MEQKELNAISDLFKSEYDKLLKEINDKLTFAYENADKLLEENNRLKTELEELKKNAIVPKFFVGQEVWYPDEFQNCVFVSKVSSITYDKRYVDIGGTVMGTHNIKNINKVFLTKAEAEEALKKLEE